MGLLKLQVIRRKRTIDPVISSAEISRRSIAESYEKYKDLKPLGPGELQYRLYLWTLWRSAKKSLVISVLYVAAAAAWFALKR